MINNVVLVGRLTKDPELKYSASGVAIARFTLAVNRTFGQDKETDFINCIAFKKTAENLANFTGKGSLIGLEGRIQTGSYQNAEGKKVFTTDILANSVQFLDSKKKEESVVITKESFNNADPFAQPAKINVFEDDMPF